MSQGLLVTEVGFSDEKVHYLSGSGAPNGTRADDAPAGSSWSDTTDGDKYSKTSTGWIKLATGGDATALANEVNAIETAVGLNTDGTYTAIAGANYATGTTIKQAVTQLDTQLKTTQTDLDTLEAAYATNLTTQDTRDDAQDVLIAAKVNKAGDTMTGNLVFDNAARIRGLGAATAADEPIIKAQLDALEVGRDYQADVWAVQTNATLVPEAILGRRYIVTDTATLNAAFGSIPGVGNNDIVQYNGTAFVVAYDVSVEGTGAIVWDKAATYFMAWDGVNWSEHGGLNAQTPGIGLSRSGNVLNVNLGAGIAELPSDEIGVDVLDNSGLFLTVNGTDASVVGGAKLAIKKADTSLTSDAAGIKVSATLQTAIAASTTGLAQEIIDRTNADNAFTTEIGNINTKLANARTEKELAAVTTAAVIDDVSVDVIESCVWVVTARGTGSNAGKKAMFEVHGIHNGTATGDATDVDYVVNMKLATGGTLTGLKATVDLVGTGTGQTMVLKVQSTMEVQVAVVREVLFF